MKQSNVFTIVLGIVSSFLFISCSKDASVEQLTVDGPIRASEANPVIYAARISIQESSFNPADVTVMHTATVLWTNNDNTVHTVTAADGSFDSGDLKPGANFSHTFNVIGVHRYRCKYHSEAGQVEAVIK